jgi:NADH-quinone oxidoreductase subunit N
MNEMIVREFILPIAIPALGGVWILVLVALQRGADLRWPAAHSMILLGLSAVAAISLLGTGRTMEVFSGAVLVDSQALVFHLIFLLIAVLTVLSAIHHLQAVGAPRGEFFALVLFAVSGMTMMASTENLLTLFLGLEILSICLYVLAGFTRDQVYAIEGALKYFILGAFSTGFVLYGMALLYGATGRIDLRGISAQLASIGQGPVDPLVLVGAALLVIGLGFKVAAVPFHFWAPDVYQGSIAPVSGFMAAGTKAAAFAALVRVLSVGLGGAAIREHWIALISVVALLTMILGNVVALTQQNIKRMLAYSSIANAGYLLVAVVAAGRTGEGPAIVIFYLAVYAFMTVGAFAVAALIGRSEDGEQGSAITAYAGLARRRPALAAAMAIFMLSLTGIPPTGGFIGKFYIFKSAMNAEMYLLAVVGVLVSVIGAFYYLRVVVQMYLREPGAEPIAIALNPAESLGIAIASIATIWIGLFPNGLLALALGAG